MDEEGIDRFDDAARAVGAEQRLRRPVGVALVGDAAREVRVVGAVGAGEDAVVVVADG